MSFEQNKMIGIFLGLSSTNYEYIAHIISPYRDDYAPVVGSFLLIDQSSEEYLVTRVMSAIPKGELTTFMGEKWLSLMARYEDSIGQDIKDSKISYQVKVKLLGRLRKDNHTFISGLTTIPHMTSRVYIPTTEIVQEICKQALKKQEGGIELGRFYLDNDVKLLFNFDQLLGKRTFIFARAGYGKSNLMKIIASNWMEHDHGALIIFDPEGEYSITDSSGRPGILDKIPAISITKRKKIIETLSENVFSSLKFNFKDFSPEFIIPIIVDERKHSTIFFQKLMTLDREQWAELVDLFSRFGWKADVMEITKILKGSNEKKMESSVPPIINNLVNPIKNLHDPDSTLLGVLESIVRNQQVCIVDISLLNSRNALQLSSIVVKYFFQKNQDSFVEDEESMNRIVFVMEEAQSVLNSKGKNATFVELAKEGRKYQLGGIFITQQPGSISKEILSQGDNFFVFHMLSKSDLIALNETNAHFSEDILTQILNEPVPGKAYVWSSPQPFVIPVTIRYFDDEVTANNAPKLQAQNPLLKKVVETIVKEKDALTSIISKLQRIIEEKHLDLSDKEILNVSLKYLTTTLLNQLSPEEKEYLDKNKTLLKGKDGNPFGILYSYFVRELIPKINLNR